ncbi:MAG: DUF1566 domain-containing protein [Deltaproteobacteria bacterium]|nr:DUF1566 domain-containing protein [Deltaproteobacteria bacterium]
MLIVLIPNGACSLNVSNNEIDSGPGDGDADADSDTDTDDDTETNTDTQCAGKPDFTLCSLVTEPDRSYDICIDGACQSPGCGTFACNPPAPHFPLADTGQRQCYGNDVEPMSCPGSVGAATCAQTPYCGQDAQYGWDVSHTSTERFDRTEPTSGEPIVTDNVTGLVWQACPADLSGSECESGKAVGYKWSQALAYCDALTWAGLDDWRVPDAYELFTIADMGRDAPALDTSMFHYGPGLGEFWTSSYAGEDSTGSYENARTVSFGSGEPSVTYVGYTNPILCVRGTPTPRPTERLTRTEPVPGETIVTDKATGLIWQGCAAGQEGTDCSGAPEALAWTEALAYCESLLWGGYGDWRLPDLKETWTIVDTRRLTPAIDLAAFPNATASVWFWSSTTHVGGWEVWPGDPDTDPVRAWEVGFEYGVLYTASKSQNPYPSATGTRCVRQGS